MKQLMLIIFLTAASVLSTIKSNAQRSLLALSKGEHVLAIVDPESLKVKSKVPVGDDPHEVVASSDGKRAYVSNSYGSNKFEIDVIDLEMGKRLPDLNIQPFASPHGLDFADGKLWFFAEGASAVGRYNPSINAVDWSMGTGQDRTHMIYVSPDAKKIYTTNVNAGTVSILEDSLVAPRFGPPPPPPNGAAPNTQPSFKPQPQHQWIQTVVKVSRGSEGFDVSPNRKELWTASADDGKIWFIDLQSKNVNFISGLNAMGANRLKFSPDGNLVFVSSLRSGDLFVIDTKNHQLIKKVKLGRGCAGILTDPEKNRIFVACTADNYIAVLDLNSYEIVDKISIAAPDGLGWTK